MCPLTWWATNIRSEYFKNFAPSILWLESRLGDWKTQMFCFNYSSIRPFVQQQSTPHHENNLNIVTIWFYSTSDSSWLIFDQYILNVLFISCFLKSCKYHFVRQIWCFVASFNLWNRYVCYLQSKILTTTTRLCVWLKFP